VNWVAHASRVLAMVFHHRELSLDYRNCFDIRTEEKFIAARHHNLHARRVRYPDEDARLPELKRRKFALAERVMLWSS
jgi:hypothetical protein